MDLTTLIIDSDISDAIRDNSRINPQDLPEMTPELLKQHQQIDYGVPLYAEIPLMPEEDPPRGYDDKPASREFPMF
jgi:hypothetical protein